MFCGKLIRFKMVLFKKDELKLLWPFYFAALFLTIFIIYAAFMIPYFISIGFSMLQIGFLISSAAFAIFLFEVPTGAVADVFGRKFSSLLGIFLSGILFIIAFFFQDFYSFIIIFFLVGVATTLISGAGEAWIVDLLRHHKKQNLIQEFYSKSASLSGIGLFVSGFMGAFLVGKFGLSIIWIVTGGTFILNGILYLFAKEHFVKRKSKVTKQLKQTSVQIKESVKYSFKHKVILIILIASAVIFLADSFSGSLAWYPFLKNLGFQDAWFGYLFSGIAFVGIFAPLLVSKGVKKLGGYKKYLVTLLIIFALLDLSVILIYVLYAALTIFMISVFFENLYSPARVTFFQSFIPSKMRATITSFREMWVAAIGIVAPPLAGFTVDKIGPQYTIVLGGLLSIPAIILYSKIDEKYKMKKIKSQ